LQNVINIELKNDRIIEEIKKYDKIFKKFKINTKNDEFFIIFLNM